MRYSARHVFEFSNSSAAAALEGSEIIPQCFDIWDIKVPSYKQELQIPDLRESMAQILAILKEAEIVPLQNIILGGISQGCATAIMTLLSTGIMLGGFIGLSGWLPFQEHITSISKYLDESPIICELKPLFRDKSIPMNRRVRRRNDCHDDSRSP